MQSIKSLISKYAKQILILGLGLVIGVFFATLFDVTLTPNPKVLTLLGITPTLPPEPPSYSSISPIVIPESGYTIPVRWGDLGIRLVEAGGVDMLKYQENYSDPQYSSLMTYLTDDLGEQGITITTDNAYFWVNTLWALGLTQRSQVLDEGIMGTEYADEVGNFASTGGWTLGSADAVKLYSSVPLITLTAEQETKVMEIAGNIYRPCCNNPTSFPDCNHGMAMLGIIELMVAQDFADADIYQAALALNSYWFPSTYIDMAYYYQTIENTPWDQVDPQVALSQEFSSASGYGQLKKQIGTVPGTEDQGGGGCGA